MHGAGCVGRMAYQAAMVRPVVLCTDTVRILTNIIPDSQIVARRLSVDNAIQCFGHMRLKWDQGIALQVYHASQPVADSRFY